MRPARMLCALLCLGAQSIAAQTTDWARITIGISLGVHGGTSLWDVPSQPVLSSNGYLPDLFHLQRDVRSGVTFNAHATRFITQKVGLTAEFAYLGLTTNDVCVLAHDGGDAELATACAYVGTDQKFGAGINPTSGYHDASGIDQSASTTLVQGGVVLRPFKPAALQPLFTAMVGFAATPRSTVAMESLYGAHADTTLSLLIYQDYGWKQVRPVLTAAVGLATAPNSGLQLHFEVRETFLAQSVVTGPTTVQGQQPPYHSVLTGIPSVMLGLEVVLKRERGKRY